MTVLDTSPAICLNGPMTETAQPPSPRQIAQNLADLMPRRIRASVREGRRVAITLEDVTAHGTIVSGWAATDGIGATVRLDGTFQDVFVPAALLQEV